MRVAVRGAAGRMGRAAVHAIEESEDCALVASFEDDASLAASLAGSGPEREIDVALDLTVPAALDTGIADFLRAGVDVVVGTSGVEPRHLEQWSKLCDEFGRSCLVVPNFCVGVVLLQRFATEAVKYFPDVELIEMHHERKVDHPSGTATDTARRIGARRRECGGAPRSPEDPERATWIDEVPVHAVRLPGLLAHQLVLFGGNGETLSLRHDTRDRAAFMPGVLTAVRHVRELGGLRVGLEHVLEF